MSTRYNAAGLIYQAFDKARRASRYGAAKKRGRKLPDDYPPALMKTKQAPPAKDLTAITNLTRRADELMGYPTLAEGAEEKEKKKKKKKKKRMERRKGEGPIKTRKNISEKPRWMP